MHFSPGSNLGSSINAFYLAIPTFVQGDDFVRRVCRSLLTVIVAQIWAVVAD
jgi:hypothetical protein